MVTIELNLKEGEEMPEQHLDEGEHIERVIVPLNQLYHKLQGTFLTAPSPCSTGRNNTNHHQRCRRKRARLSMLGK